MLPAQVYTKCGLESDYQDKLWIDAGFWGGIVPSNAANHSLLQGMLDAGALGFKSFMSPSGQACPWELLL